MTIKVEHEAVLQVLQPPCCHHPLDQLQDCGSYKRSIDQGFYPVKPLLSSTCGDDDASVDTLSTASLSSDDEDDVPKRVSFAEDIVSDVWTRPYTDRKTISDLYYSIEDTTKFRQEYRLERKLISDLALSEDVELPLEPHPQGGRHSISRVVVLHNNSIETFTNDGEDFFDSDSFWSGSITWY